MNRVADIRSQFKAMSPDSETGMLEIINASFIADEPAIFGTPNEDWHSRELHWYKSQSLNVNDIQEPVPTIWKQIASVDGEINSNYGWCIWSEENCCQYTEAIHALLRDKNTRQAIMIYTRPTMHDDASRDGMRDFICTNTTQLFIRQNKLHYIVNMRSNDAVLGYKGDFAWQKYVHSLALRSLSEAYTGLELGDLYWNAASLHVYSRHFELVANS
jgi:thymidylate synthase